MDEQGFSVKDIIGIFKRRIRLIAVVAGSIFLGSVVIAAVLKDQFSVYTTILVEPQSISRKLVETDETEADVMSRLHLMTMQILARARLSKVIDELGLYAEESEEKTREEVIDMMRGRIHVEPVLPDLDPELQRRMEVQVNTFRLFFRHDNPVLAAAVANRLANDYIDEHIKERVQSSGDTADFVESELQRLGARIREIEGQIAQVKAQNSGSLPEDLLSNQRKLERAFDTMAMAQQRLAEAQSDEAFYRQQAVVARESGGGGGVTANAQVLSPNQRLQQLENQLGELRSRGFTDKHPDIVAIQAEMEQVSTRIASDHDSDSERAPASLAEQQALAEAQRAALRIESQQKEIARLQAEMDEAQERLGATPRVAEQIDGLTREYQFLSVSFQEYSNKRLEAGVAANMERRQKGEQFRVLEPAYAPATPTSPNRVLILFLGALLGVGAGAGVALLLEAADSSYHDPRALQNALRIPVLASIPGILLDADLARLRRRQIREAVAAVAVTGLVLTGALAGYVVVNKPHLLGGGPEAPAAPAEEAAPEAPPAPLGEPTADAGGPG